MNSAWFDELAEFIRIPSVSADVERGRDVRDAGEWVCDFVRRAGGQAELREWEGHPLALGEISAFGGNGSAPTVICYGHFDVQPPAPLELWESEPFELARRDDRLYGRGALNAMHVLARIIDAVVAKDGRLSEPLRAGVAAPTDEELAGWRELAPGAEELASQGARPMDPRAAEEFYVRTFAEPSLDGNGIEGGSPHLQKTVLPVEGQGNPPTRPAP